MDHLRRVDFKAEGDEIRIVLYVFFEINCRR